MVVSTLRELSSESCRRRLQVLFKMTTSYALTRWGVKPTPHEWEGIPDLRLVHMVGGEASVSGTELDPTGQNDALRHRHAASSLASVIHKRSDQPLMPEGLVTGCEMVDCHSFQPLLGKAELC